MSGKTVKIKIVKKKRVGRPCAPASKKACEKKVKKLTKEVKRLRGKVERAKTARRAAAKDGGFLKMKMKNDAVKARAMARGEGKKVAAKKAGNTILKKQLKAEKNKRSLAAIVKKVKSEQAKARKSQLNALKAEQRYKKMLVNQADASTFFKGRRQANINAKKKKPTFDTSTFNFAEIVKRRGAASSI